jgi:endonuclease/exonuclease/phosphatase family metal-dependent hydrolase
MNLFRTALRISNLILILLTFIAYLSSWTKPQEMWYIQFVGMAYPWLLFCNIILIIIWLRLKTRYYLFSLATILLGWSHFSHFVGWSILNGSTDGFRLKVLTYNIDNFSYFLKSQDFEKRYAAFEKFITKENPDLICLQESFITTPEYSNRIKKFPCLAAYPYIVHPVEKGIVIFSKIPPLQQGKIQLSEDRNETANGANFADFNINSKPIRLIITHLQSNSVTERTAAIINNPNLRDEETQETAKSVIRGIRNMSYFRAKQSEQIKAFIKKSPYPVIVAGDFNDTPQSYTYAQISEGLQDAFAEKGFGLGITYGGKIPALRIDYILVSPKLKVLSHRIPSQPFSDHYPVVAEIGVE